MPNVHTPERLEGESFGDYKARRQASAAINREIRRVGLGDQHKAGTSREQQRDSARKVGNLRGIYGVSIKRYFDRKWAQASAQRRARRLEATMG